MNNYDTTIKPNMPSGKTTIKAADIESSLVGINVTEQTLTWVPDSRKLRQKTPSITVGLPGSTHPAIDSIRRVTYRAGENGLYSFYSADLSRLIFFNSTTNACWAGTRYLPRDLDIVWPLESLRQLEQYGIAVSDETYENTFELNKAYPSLEVFTAKLRFTPKRYAIMLVVVSLLIAIIALVGNRLSP